MKLRIKYFIVISLGIILSACEENPISDINLYESEKYKVFSDIINSEFSEGLIYILDSTASGIWIQNKNPYYLPDTIQSVFPSLKSETIENYKFLNNSRTPINNNFNLSVNYEIVSPNDSLNYSFPIIDFTNPAFDNLSKQALMYFGVMLGRGGYGRFLFLEKVEENWVIKKTMFMWVSR